MVLSAQDRIASIQAGSWGAVSVGLVALLCECGNYWIQFSQMSPVPTPHLFSTQLWVSVCCAALSGFLFGVTYRYIRRSDPNPHLQTGAIAAFGLTRGLAQLDLGLLLQGQIEWIVLMAGESMLMMAIAALSLDWAMARSWIQRVQS